MIVDEGANLQHPALLAQQAEQEAAQAKPANETPTDERASTVEKSAPSRRYAGKYESVEELEKGYWNSAQEAQRIAAENKALRDLVTSQQRVNPAERAEERKNYAEELREAAIPVDALDAYIDERAQRLVRAAFEPLARGAQARSEVMSEYPEYETKEKDMAQFLSANPRVNDEFQKMMNAGLERAAMEYVFLQFERQNGAQNRSDASGQEQAAARATAALTGNTVGARDVANSFETRLSEARERFDKDGDPIRLAQALAEVFPTHR